PTGPDAGRPTGGPARDGPARDGPGPGGPIRPPVTSLQHGAAIPVPPMGDLFDGYAPTDILGVRAWDEMFESTGVSRPAARRLRDALQALAIDEFESRCAARD